jgi:hypothetical protein
MRKASAFPCGIACKPYCSITCPADIWCPSMGLHVGKNKPLFDHLPNRLTYRQWKKRCAIVSWVCLQSGQSSQFVHPLFSSLSPIQSLFWIANQDKNPILEGAQCTPFFHTGSLRTKELCVVGRCHGVLAINFSFASWNLFSADP